MVYDLFIELLSTANEEDALLQHWYTAGMDHDYHSFNDFQEDAGKSKCISSDQVMCTPIAIYIHYMQ